MKMCAAKRKNEGVASCGGDAKRTILVAGMGTTPAVLTETVWALAHQKPAVVPDEIVVVTTKSARDTFCRTVMEGTPSVWEQLCAELRREKIAIEGKLVLGDTSIRIIPDASGNGMDDLRSGEDNLRAADFMLQTLRQYTESSDTVVLASIAGGRKTMSALLLSCMTLLGRADDKVYHVLAAPEFEGLMKPPFFFPKKGVAYVNSHTGKTHRGAANAIELFEVPFVRMRGWYQEKFKTIPPSYRTLISKVQSTAPAAIVYPEIEIDVWNGVAKLDGRFVKMSASSFAALVALGRGCPVRDLSSRLFRLHSMSRVGDCMWLSDFREGSLFKSPNVVEDVRHVMSNLRAALKKGGFAEAETLVPQRNAPQTFPMSKITFVNEATFSALFEPPSA